MPYPASPAEIEGKKAFITLEGVEAPIYGLVEVANYFIGSGLWLKVDGMWLNGRYVVNMIEDAEAEVPLNGEVTNAVRQVPGTSDSSAGQLRSTDSETP